MNKTKLNGKAASSSKLEDFGKTWFEMQDLSSSLLNKKVWVPLRVVEKQSKGEYGQVGFNEVFFGLGTIAVPIKDKNATKNINWQSLGISYPNSGFYDDRESVYIPSDVYRHFPGDLEGLHLILEIPGNGLEKTQWEPHQDFVVTLGLIREVDTWLCPSEGYLDVIKLHRDEEGGPKRIEIRADHLTDYLCARGMGLFATFYTSRSACFDKDPKMGWKSGTDTPQQRKNGKWEGREWPIHEGGHPYGEKWAVFRVGRTDGVESEDLPDISSDPTDENTVSEQWEKGFKGKKLHKVMGEFWGTEWLDPAKISKRVKNDKIPSSAYFSIDEKGAKVNGDELIDNGKWLWFKPDVVMALVHRRGGSLKWYTRNTGEISCLPHYGVHFGVNNLGLVNVFAHDIGSLPEWQQQIWSGYNISPDGGVSTELLASQVHAKPAKTQSPEEFLRLGIKAANHFSLENLGINLFNNHEALPDILEKIHRFRALDKASLLGLAKDLTRVTADSLNRLGIQSIAHPANSDNIGSLKSLEYLLATKVGEEKAKLIMKPLFKIYDLRLGDAHLPSESINEAFSALDIEEKQPFVLQGTQMIHKVVAGLYRIINVLKNWKNL